MCMCPTEILFMAMWGLGRYHGCYEERNIPTLVTLGGIEQRHYFLDCKFYIKLGTSTYIATHNYYIHIQWTTRYLFVTSGYIAVQPVNQNI